MSDHCQYPNCRCPFDMGPDNLCLIGKPNTDATPPVSAGADQESEDFPVWHACPECGCLMTVADPADAHCDIWYCGECGFNEPSDDDPAELGDAK